MTGAVRIGDFTMWRRPSPGLELSRFSGFAIDQDGYAFDGVDVRRETADRQQSHGEHDAPGLLTGKSFSLSGWCRASTPERMDFYHEQLLGLMADGGAAVIVLERPGGNVWGRVRLGGRTKFRVRAKTPKVADWQLSLWMPDPRMYGDTVTFGPVPAGTELEVFHRGNFPAMPRFEVAGTIGNGYAVYGPGVGASRKRYKVNGAVAPGHPNTIDMRTGYTYVDGGLRVGVVDDATNWAVGPGLTGLTKHMLDANGGAATLTVSVEPTYVL